MEKPKTIFVIEDEAAMRQTIEKALRQTGYRVLGAGDATAAMEIWNTEGPGIDLVLTDILMPGLSGPELVRELRTSQPNLRVLVMSGSHEAVVLDTVELADPKVFLAKPFDHQTLLRAVAQALA